MFSMFKPLSYHGKENAEVKYTNDFEQMSLIITKYTGQNAKKMTILEYHHAQKALKKEIKKSDKKGKPVK